MNIQLQENTTYTLNDIAKFVNVNQNKFTLIEESWTREHDAIYTSLTYFNDIESFKKYLFEEIKNYDNETFIVNKYKEYLDSDIIVYFEESDGCYYYKVPNLNKKQFEEIKNDYDNYFKISKKQNGNESDSDNDNDLDDTDGDISESD